MLSHCPVAAGLGPCTGLAAWCGRISTANKMPSSDIARLQRLIAEVLSLSRSDDSLVDPDDYGLLARLLNIRFTALLRAQLQCTMSGLTGMHTPRCTADVRFAVHRSLQ